MVKPPNTPLSAQNTAFIYYNSTPVTPLLENGEGDLPPLETLWYTQKGRGSNNMLCNVCGINKLKGRQKKYCSRNCERKSWRDSNHEKLLEAKKLYRERNKEKIYQYQKEYRQKHRQLNSYQVDNFKYGKRCLRCDNTEKIEVHHIKHQRFGGQHDDPNNLLVLCKNCHALWHKFFDVNYWSHK